MRLQVLAAALCLVGCAHSVDDGFAPIDASEEESGPQKELVCAPNFCGTIVDKSTGATADCGSCPGYQVCGDNGVANVCGAECVPLTSTLQSDSGPYDVSPACTYAFGPGWFDGYASNGVQIPGGCSYTNPDNCAQVYNTVPQDQPCSSSVCGVWWCCLDQPDAGIDPLLPGAVADNDGGLP